MTYIAVFSDVSSTYQVHYFYIAHCRLVNILVSACQELTLLPEFNLHHWLRYIGRITEPL